MSREENSKKNRGWIRSWFMINHERINKECIKSRLMFKKEK